MRVCVCVCVTRIWHLKKKKGLYTLKYIKPINHHTLNGTIKHAQRVCKRFFKQHMRLQLQKNKTNFQIINDEKMHFS